MKLSLLVVLIPATSATQQVLNAFGEPSYGVDVSFPVHHRTFAPDQPLGDRQKLYDDFMAGCRRHYGSNGQACDNTEEDRVEMSKRQPSSMQVRVNKDCIFDDVNEPCPDCSLSRIIQPKVLRRPKHPKTSLIFSQVIGRRTTVEEYKRNGPVETHM